MQFYLLTTVLSVLASASVAHAGVVGAADLLEARQAGCEYTIRAITSVCIQGTNLFCSGNTNVCASLGKKDSLDAKATSTNELVCQQKKLGQPCGQTTRCCP